MTEEEDLFTHSAAPDPTGHVHVRGGRQHHHHLRVQQGWQLTSSRRWSSGTLHPLHSTDATGSLSHRCRGNNAHNCWPEGEACSCAHTCPRAAPLGREGEEGPRQEYCSWDHRARASQHTNKLVKPHENCAQKFGRAAQDGGDYNVKTGTHWDSRIWRLSRLSPVETGQKLSRPRLFRESRYSLEELCIVTCLVHWNVRKLTNHVFVWKVRVGTGMT